MKKLKAFIVSFLMILSASTVNVSASDKEMRAAWISTVYNMDWPSSKNNETAQKREYIELLDKLKSVGINTVVVQVRPKADAIYKSNINPWSEYLTGTQGKDPGYDPLPFLIDEAHKRGMEFHAWFNPYRVTTTGTDLSKLASNNPARLHPDWVLKCKNGSNEALIYNPGLPEVRKHIVDSVNEVVKNYNIDGVHFDDYFYRSGIDDSDTYNKYKKPGQSIEDWRRENVNTLLKEVKTSIKEIKPNVEFGVSPKGIWRNKDSDPTGSDTRGAESYSDDFADTRTWIRQGLVDYVVPQLYWPIGYSAADYSKLVSWWANEVRGYDVDLYIGQGVYKNGTGDYPGQDVAGEIKEQINLNRQYSDIKGSMYFSARDIVKNSKLQSDMKDLYVNNIKITELKGEDRYETACKISKEGWKEGAKTVILTNGNSVVDGVTATPLASVNDAPILLVQKDGIPTSTKDEIKRLNPSNIIVIGGEGSVNNKIMDELKSILPSVSLTRIGGIDRYETSLQIAKRISEKVDINKVYLAGGYGEVDALSIASQAGIDKQPIILSGKDSLSENVYNWLKSQGIQEAYFVGGKTVLSDEVIKQVNKITLNNVLNNRISGDDRQETNAKIIGKFYPQNKYNTLLVTKSNPLVDALTAGPLAAKLNSPIVILGDTISETQKTVLGVKNTQSIHKIGGGINDTAFNNVVNLVK